MVLLSTQNICLNLLVKKYLQFYIEKCRLYRVRTDLEKSLSLTSVLENSWSLKKCLLSWNFLKSSLKIWISLWIIQDTTSPFRFIECAKKLWKLQNESKSLDKCHRARCDSYSIPFNLCGSPGYYHCCQSEPFHFDASSWKKCIFSCWFIQNWEEIESLKSEKSPGIVLEFCFPISVRTLLSKPVHLLINVLTPYAFRKKKSF